MKKIVLLKSHLSSIGGLEKYTLRLAEGFVKKGCEVTLLTTGTEAPKIEGVEVVLLGKRSKFSLYHLLHFDHLCRKWLGQNRVDCIFGMERNRFQTHYRAGSGVHAAFLAQRKLSEPFLKRITFPLNPLHRTLLSLEKEAFENKGLKRIFANSEMVKKELLDHFSLPASKIEVVHNGVEWENFASPFEKSVENRSSSKHTFLFIGNDYRRKGLQFLLSGLALLKNVDFHLNVIGKEKQLTVYKKMVSQAGLEGRVSFYGPLSNVLPFYAAADTLVLPTLYDPFANVILEALAMGLFVVTSPFNGAKEILDKECGAVIEDLYSDESVKKSLEIALFHPKTRENGKKIREKIKDLDFSNKLNKIVDVTINSL